MGETLLLERRVKDDTKRYLLVTNNIDEATMIIGGICSISVRRAVQQRYVIQTDRVF